MTNLPKTLDDPSLQYDYERLRNLDGPVSALGDPGDSDHSADGLLGADQVASVESGLDLFDPGFFGVDQADWPMADVGDEAGSEGTSKLGSKLSHAETHYLPFARKKEGRLVLKKITIDDFDNPEERIVFLAIEKHKVDLFGHKANREDKRAAVRWFFCSEDHGGLTFELCCEVLDSRPDIIRMRIHYEFWLRWAKFEEEFPFMTVPLPSILHGEIMYYAGQEGVEVAQEAWLQPGIEIASLLTKAAGKDSLAEVPKTYHKALEILEEQYVMSPQHESWYMTGRNPLNRRLDLEKQMGRNVALGSTIHWSRLFMRPRQKS